VSPVKYELCFYIPEDEILHSHRRENPQFYIFFILLFLGLHVHDVSDVRQKCIQLSH
jgi:hypothetical protein